MKAISTFALTLGLLTQTCIVMSALTEGGLKEIFENVYEQQETAICTKANQAEFDYDTDIGNEKKEQANVDVTLEAANLTKSYFDAYFKDINPDDIKDETLKRQLKKALKLGNGALDEDKLKEFTTVTDEMQKIYSTAKICPYKDQKCDLTKAGLDLEPGIQAILIHSRDYDELSYAWEAWRDASGAPMRDLFKTYVNLSNEAAILNNFMDKGEMWRDSYESDTFVADIDDLWDQVEPLYLALHEYVGRKLKKAYGDKLDISDGLIPAHLFGDMWAQQWSNIGDLVVPFPKASKIDADEVLKARNFTVLDMFDVANEFYQSLGLPDDHVCYDTEAGAMIERPQGREVQCHASSFDFCDGKDYRIKMCTEVTFEYLTTIHHEMGHIHYFMQYANQPILFRDGANPGFHEAIGDTIALSMSTPKHLAKINLTLDYEDNYESSINALMDMALQKIAFLPFGLLIDKWRWDVFSGAVKPEEWNQRWWEYRAKYQKVKPPVPRSDSKDFDPGAKNHISADYPYIAYYVSFIIQFQFYEALCTEAGQYDPKDPQKNPLHNCDFYQSTKAGDLLSSALKLGASKPWTEVMKILTGQEKMDAKPLLEYFQPLYEFLKKQNDLKDFLEVDYEKAATDVCITVATAEFNYDVDIKNGDKEQTLEDAILNAAKFDRSYWENHFRNLNPDEYDEGLKREINNLKFLGNAALEEDKLKQLTNDTDTMGNIYSTAKICPYDKQECDLATEGLNLEPGIESILIESRDYDELVYAWKSWRDVSGAKMKDIYKDYVSLSNEAAVANNFSDKGEMWRSSYESDTFVEEIDKLWETVEPLYSELHKYVGGKLKAFYGDRLDISDGLIPAHVFGNMWAQDWEDIRDLVVPFSKASKIDVDSALKDQNYTILKMFDVANEFYQSLGLFPDDICYNTSAGAMIEKPTDGREVLCHASAWDLCDGQNFRIKMCAEVTFEYLTIIHHEMGHIQYYMQYAHQPIAFRGGANPGFHEAIGDTIALSVATPKHLQKINLLKDYQENDESSINTLMDMALQKIAFLPFGLLIDKWRWDVFSGDVKPEEWNKQWWFYREKYQKVKAPVPRSDETDFDPGAKYHIPGDYSYIAYYVSYIIQFQFYKALCIEAGEYGPQNPGAALHQCDYYQSKKAGDKLSAALSLGSSKHWKDVMEILTGQREMDATALVEYFQPLYEYLKKENEKPDSTDNPGRTDKPGSSAHVAASAAVIVLLVALQRLMCV